MRAAAGDEIMGPSPPPPESHPPHSLHAITKSTKSFCMPSFTTHSKNSGENMLLKCVAFCEIGIHTWCQSWPNFLNQSGRFQSQIVGVTDILRGDTGNKSQIMDAFSLADHIGNQPGEVDSWMG